MMGRQKPPQPSLFYLHFNLDQRIPEKHLLRRVLATVDFDFVYREVEDLYGGNGNESVDPGVIVKLMLVMGLENVSSERYLMEILPARLDWLWFLGMDLDSPIPDHSVLSKARRRWGPEVFRSFFVRVLWSCVEAGLVDGSKIFCDGSLIDAKASRKSIVKVELADLDRASDELEMRLVDSESPDTEKEPEDRAESNDSSANDEFDSEGDGDELATVEPRLLSTTDPDAAVVTKRGAGPARARYKTHRAVDDRFGVITATILTPGDQDEGHQLEALINQHQANTGDRVQTVAADTQYGTADNYLMCHDRDIVTHIPPVQDVVRHTQEEGEYFSAREFTYDPSTDSYQCPAAQTLRAWQKRPEKNALRYAAGAKVCGKCSLRNQCTSGKFRTITRHVRQDLIDSMIAQAKTNEARRDLRRRKHLMEGSFGTGTQHGLKRCPWLGIDAATIHDLLVATTQNVKLLLRHGIGPTPTAVAAALHIVSQLSPTLDLASRLPFGPQILRFIRSLPPFFTPAHPSPPFLAPA